MLPEGIKINMKCLVISDSHGNDGIKNLALLRKADMKGYFNIP